MILRNVGVRNIRRLIPGGKYSALPHNSQATYGIRGYNAVQFGTLSTFRDIAACFEQHSC